MVREPYSLPQVVEDLEKASIPLTAVQATPEGWRVVPRAELTGGFVSVTLDSRAAGQNDLFVALPGRQAHGRQFTVGALAAGAHVLTDRVPGELPSGDSSGGNGAIALVVADPLAALSELAAAWRARLPVRVIGVTGSNGKTTTKDLLAAAVSTAGPVLATSGNLNSEQGVPLTLLALDADHRLAVVEMGASAVGHIASRARLARPQIGVITNAAAAHLEEFGDLEQIIEGKGELVAALPGDGVAVLNADSPGFAAWCDRAPCRVVSWGKRAGTHRWSWRPGDDQAAGWVDLDGESWPVPLPGRHNGANLVAAILAARVAGLDDAAIREGLATFRPSPHRAHLRRLGGRLVLDDTYNANPTSMVAAARMLGDLKGGAAVAVLGAMAELGPQSDQLQRECGAALAPLELAALLAVGAGATAIADGHEASGGRTIRCADHAEAARWLAENTEPGDRILLKGSRSAAMEEVAERLGADHGWAEDGS
jgi:UDP-N-acetylmuramoyl-tripeptide--D-alanyl-D-alanine ligase